MNIEKVYSDLTAAQLNQRSKQKQLHKQEVDNLRPTTMYGNDPQVIFAALVRIATPILEDFHSDLYWDVVRLQELDLTIEHTLFYLVGKNGTTWADNYAQAISLSKHGRPHIFRILYKRHDTLNKCFTFTIEKVAGLYGITPEVN